MDWSECVICHVLPCPEDNISPRLHREACWRVHWKAGRPTFPSCILGEVLSIGDLCGWQRTSWGPVNQEQNGLPLGDSLFPRNLCLALDLALANLIPFFPLMHKQPHCPPPPTHCLLSSLAFDLPSMCHHGYSLPYYCLPANSATGTHGIPFLYLMSF